MTEPGTFERIAAMLGDAVLPLGKALADPGELLVELGVAIDDDALAPVAGAAASTAAAIAELGGFVASLNVAIDTDDGIGITTNGAAVAVRIGAVLDGLEGMQGGITAALNSASVTPAQRTKALDMLNDLPGRILTRLIVDRLRAEVPKLTMLLAALGLLEGRNVPGDAADPMFPPHFSWRIHWDRLGQFLGDPLSLPRDVYGFGTPGFDGRLLLELFARLMDTGDIRIDRPYITTGTGGVGAVLVGPALIVGVRDGGLAIPTRLGITGKATQQIPLGERSAFTVSVDGTLTAGSEIRLSPTLQVGLTPPPGAPPATLTATAAVTVGKPGEPTTLLGITGLGGLSVETVNVSLTLAAPGDLGIGIAMNGAKFGLDVAGAGGLIAALLPKNALDAPVDLAIDITGGKLRFRGGVGLSLTVPVDISIGPLTLQSFTIGLTLGGGAALPVELSVDVRTMLGPLVVIVQRMGLTMRLDAPAGGGNVGPFAIEGSFKAPTGLGIDLDAGPIQGGGFLAFDPAAGRYAGVLRLKFTMIGITAYGIYEDAPGGAASFVAVLGVRFFPGIQFGFGFALTGVGGMIGYNRRADADLLRNRLASGATGNVLFAEDPVKNAPTLLGDLAALFPPAAGSFIVGPTVQLSWAAPIVRLDVAVLIEMPGPSKIIILGSIKVMIGVDETLALLYLRMDFLGILDFERKLVSLDAYLVNSHALGVFRLTGGMAFRLSYGDNPYILLSIGGFHPRFDPGPLNVPALPRVGAVMNGGALSPMYLRLEMYLAFTSNTLQLGARVEAGMELGPIGAHGYIQFDALVQFRPFSFDLEFAAGFEVEVFGQTLCSVNVRGTLTGPGPLVVHAEARVRLLFIKVSGSATVELGGNNADAVQPVPNLLEVMTPELTKLSNLRSTGDDRTVVLRPNAQVENGVLLSPKGALIWEQRRVPLRTIVDRFEGAPLGGPHELNLVTGGWSLTDETDWFSPGMFTSLDVKASQTMNNAGFQELTSGKRFGGTTDVSAPNPKPYTPRIDLIKRPTRSKLSAVVGSYLIASLSQALSERDATPAVEPGRPRVTVAPETADLITAEGGTITGLSPFQAFQMTRREPRSVAVPTADTVVFV